MSLEGLRLAVPRGALHGRHARPARPPRRRHRRGARRTTASCCSRTPAWSRCGPSDVPTYVEAGAADIGITGKDVLAEQAERDVYELLDLGFGPCRMVFATVDGEDPAAEALRRLGVMRVATKYPKIAARYFERTGRQAEIVEVKGSVELAPLTGLVEGIVDLTATGTTLRENGLVIREEIARLDGAADRQPGRPQAQGGGDRPAAWSASVRLELHGGDAPPRSLRRCARPSPRPASVADVVAAIVERRARRGATRRCSSTSARFSGNEPRGPVRAGRARRRRSTALDPAVARRAEAARPRTCARSPRPALDAEAEVDAARGPDGPPARGARCAAPRSTRPAAATRTRRRWSWAPSRPAPRASTRSSWPRPAAPDDPRRRRAVRRRRGLPHGRRAGDRRARLRHRDDPAGRRDRRPRQPVGAGGQAPGVRRRRHRRLRRAQRPDDHRVRGRRPRAAAARPAGPGRARRGLARRGGQRRRGAAGRGSRTSA